MIKHSFKRDFISIFILQQKLDDIPKCIAIMAPSKLSWKCQNVRYLITERLKHTINMWFYSDKNYISKWHFIRIFGILARRDWNVPIGVIDKQTKYRNVIWMRFFL